MNDLERVKILKTFGNLQQLERIMRRWITYEAEKNSYQLRPRSIWVRFEILNDVSVVAPVVDESELEY